MHPPSNTIVLPLDKSSNVESLILLLYMVRIEELVMELNSVQHTILSYSQRTVGTQTQRISSRMARHTTATSTSSNFVFFSPMKMMLNNTLRALISNGSLARKIR
jgi:hypothetical protein